MTGPQSRLTAQEIEDIDIDRRRAPESVELFDALKSTALAALRERDEARAREANLLDAIPKLRAPLAEEAR